MIYGDGCAVVKFRNGDINIFNREFLSGYPYYFSYQLDEDRNENYFNINEKVNQSIYINNERIFLDEWDIKEISYWPIEYPSEIVEWVALFSDGIQSFYKVNEFGKREYIDSLEMIKRFTDFKNYHGIFVERHVRSVMKQLKKENIFHYDDFSMAGMYLEE
jgi:hypothetical protein